MSMTAEAPLALHYDDAPFAHLVLPQLLATTEWPRLRFPDVPVVPGVRTGRMIAIGDALWDDVMSGPGWAELRRVFTSQAFVSRVLAQFADEMKRLGCLVDPDAAYLDGFVEGQPESKQRTLSETDDPNALFVRFDFQAGTQSYGKRIHCDLPRRVVGGVLFMTNAEDEGMEGGEFGMWRDAAFANDRVCHKPVLEKTFAFEANKGVLFLNANNGFHGPLPIQAISGERKWIYYSISSRRDVWPQAAALLA
ncbi:MAG: hypothetical protein WDM79_17670 [Terricaulis sp.]